MTESDNFDQHNDYFTTKKIDNCTIIGDRPKKNENNFMQVRKILECTN